MQKPLPSSARRYPLSATHRWRKIMLSLMLEIAWTAGPAASTATRPVLLAILNAPRTSRSSGSFRRSDNLDELVFWHADPGTVDAVLRPFAHADRHYDFRVAAQP